MHCHHEGVDQLVWEALVTLPWQAQYTYKYAVVREEEVNKGRGGGKKTIVDKWDTQERTLVMHEGLINGDVIEVIDSSWLDPSHPSTIMTSSAFTKVIKCTHVARPSRPVLRHPPAIGEAIVRFRVCDFGLHPGQVLCVTGSIPALGNWNDMEALVLTAAGGHCWEGEVRLPYVQFPFNYKYAIRGGGDGGGGGGLVDGMVLGGGGGGGTLASLRIVGGPGSRQSSSSQPGSPQVSSATTAYSGGMFTSAPPIPRPPLHPPPSQPFPPPPAPLTILPPSNISGGIGGVGTAFVPPGVGLGGGGGIGGAIAAAALPPSSVAGASAAAAGAAAAVHPLGPLPAFELEVGDQRVMQLPLAGSIQMGAPALIVCDDGFFRRDHLWRGAGLAIPIFSIRTRMSVGVGEFLDLIPLIDLAAKTGLTMIQILPINDTSVHNMWWDSYPYSTISVFALHPLYLNLSALRAEMPREVEIEVDSARSLLQNKEVLYEETMKVKGRISRLLFDRFGPETLESPAFKEWFAVNRDWLQPYAIFKVLKDLFGTAEHWQWGSLAHPSLEDMFRLTATSCDHHRALQYTYYIQYHLHTQLLSAARHAEVKRVVLKGDIPIGVDKRSVDTWLEPHLFRMDKSTGAPPDYFDPNGQNWGFPTYDWDAMANDGYLWWRRRLRHMAQYFSAYRIDHILGFFRIWEIPGDCTTGQLGYFRPSVPISKSELESRGVWDIERLVQPYIRWPILNELFGKMASDVAARYLEEPTPGVFQLRPQYASEKQIAAIKVREDSPQWLVEETDKARAGLLRLRQNVILLRDPVDPSEHFHPRFNLVNTSSYRDLPQSWKESLEWLHDDYLFGRQEELWRESALKKLPVLMKATDMLVCGEDLGFVPNCVPPVMNELGLLGVRIQRMSTEAGKEFNNPANYPYLTVCSPSCHDVTPLRAWYEGDAQLRERFFYEALNATNPTPPEQCTPDIVRTVIQQHLSCPSAWAVFPIQDLMALSGVYARRPATEEVINDPTVTKHYWRYRMHVNVEDLATDPSWVQQIKDMLVEGGRAPPPPPRA